MHPASYRMSVVRTAVAVRSRKELGMARKGRLSKAAGAAKVLARRATRRLRRPGNAAKTVAGAALGAAAIAATGVVAKKVADATGSAKASRNRPRASRGRR